MFTLRWKRRLKQRNHIVLNASCSLGEIQFLFLLQSFFVTLHLNNLCYVYIKTGSAEESKEKSDQQPGADEDQNDEKLHQADEDQEGNLSDEGEDDREDTGQQGQEGFPETDEPANLDLPDDLQLDEEGNEGSEGRQHYFFKFLNAVASLVSRFSFHYRRFHI